MDAVGLGNGIVEHTVQIPVELVGIEGSDGGHQACHGLQTGVERLVGAELVDAHLAAPEALAGEAHEPVGDVVDDKCLDEASGARGLVGLVALLHLADEGVQRRENPAVHFRALAHGNFGLLEVPAVHVGIHRQEAVRLVELAEEGAGDLLNSCFIVFEVIPWL